jgi:chitodextrinase
MNTVTWSPYSYDSGSHSRKDVNPARDVTAYLEKKDDGGNFITLGKVQESGKASIHWIAGELNSASSGGDFALPSDGYYIRVVNNKTGATDRSDKPFTLLPKPIKIKVNGKEDWVEIPNVKTPITISWETTPGATACHLYGMKGISESAIQPSKGSVTGLVDYKKNSSNDTEEIFYSYGVGFYCTKNGNTIKDYARFSITSLPQEEASLKITSPNGGEVFDLNKQMVSEYIFEGLNSASFALYKNDKWFAWLGKDINVSQSKNGTYSFIPSAAVPGLTVGEKVYKLYITGQRADGEGYIEDKSDAPFSFIANSASSAGLELGNVIDGTGTSDSLLVVAGNGENNYTKQSLEYEITAVGDDMWVNMNDAYRGSASAAHALSYEILKDGVPTSEGVASVGYGIDSADIYGNYYKIEEADGYTMYVNITYTPTATGNYSFRVNGVGFNDDAEKPTMLAVPDYPKDYISDDVYITRTNVTPTLRDITPPTPPTNLKGVANSGTQVSLSWSAATDAGGSGLVGYAIYRNDADKQIGFSTTTSYFDSSRTPATSYVYKVASLDKAGNESSKASAAVTTLAPATTPVLAPTCTLTANKSSYILGETITYSWTSKNTTYAGWKQDTSGKDHLLLPGDKLPANGTQAVPASVIGNPPVTLTVGGVGGTGSCSLTVAVTSPTPAVTIDKTVPTVPASATIANVAAIAGSGWSVDLSWGASTDNVGVTGYIVKRLAPTASTLTTTTGKTYKLTDLVLTTEYTVSIQAKDARGNLGPARVVKFKLNFAGMGVSPTVQIISNTVDTAVQKVVAQAPNQTPLTSAEQSTKIETLTSLMNKLIELKAMMASVKMSR